MKWIVVISTHLAAACVGFAAGIYLLPILTEPPPPSSAELAEATRSGLYTTEFRRDLTDSDALHWGEGKVTIGRNHIALEGAVSPGPAYKLYLSPVYLEPEAEFLAQKRTMAAVGDVKTFENFVVPMPASVDPDAYKAVIIWCEAFDQFITAAAYRE